MKSNDSTPSPRPEREVAQPVRFLVSGMIFRKLTFKERVKILFGDNLILETHIACQHSPGRTQPLSKVTLTKHDDAVRAIDAHREVLLEQKRVADAKASEGKGPNPTAN